jgi:hypothetical protein
MKRSMSPRLRTPVKMAIGGAAVLAVGGAIHGWATVLAVLPVVVAATVGYYLWAGRETEVAAVIRHQTDERQAILRLKMQALVGRVRLNDNARLTPAWTTARALWFPILSADRPRTGVGTCVVRVGT